MVMKLHGIIVNSYILHVEDFNTMHESIETLPKTIIFVQINIFAPYTV